MSKKTEAPKPDDAIGPDIPADLLQALSQRSRVLGYGALQDYLWSMHGGAPAIVPPKDRSAKEFRPSFSTKLGKAFNADSLSYMRSQVKDNSVDLIMTSPPFCLLTPKEYGNEDQEKYLQWFADFAHEFHRVLKPSGSLVIDIGGSWYRGQPSRSLYQYELLLMLCNRFGFHLAQEVHWWNPAKLPSPAEWVTIRRVRLKDAVNTIWWLSKTPFPKASNRRVLWPYSDSMKTVLEGKYNHGERPSGHKISQGYFEVDHGGSIAPNLIALPNTESNTHYQSALKELDLKPHPARFPVELPEFFVRLLTDKGDLVLDPFAGSCTTGEAAERLQRKWICCELEADYLKGAKHRFEAPPAPPKKASGGYIVQQPKPPADDEPLDPDGGRTRK